ncbi:MULTISPECIES: hypothetical protein [unclassified Roseateles]|uniref:hypothetical protein n=1 Tax=unclassified Roseateles TaxID=2626991 RepID=UPI0006FF8886|nr:MULTISPECIES: hypothetical protein [unclassified Roseateles]KQW51203.1 hypothetical protein ASC81_00675 [Pelomonas sp. Root405]KRA77435.1 hypothetical protein ASD88_00675 [Pelomonas sp. Root662]
MASVPQPLLDTAPTSRDEYLHQYLEDKLRIPCVRIRLTQLAVEKPTVYEAPGTLELGKSFGVKGDLRAPKPGSSIKDAFAQLSMTENYELGQLVRDDQYFELEAMTSEGVHWTCPRVTVRERPGQDECAVLFEASYVENISQAEEPAYAARLTYIEKLRMPENHRVDEVGRNGSRFIGRDGSKGRLANLELNYVRRFRDETVERGELTVHAVGGAIPPRHFDVRVEEAMMFCSALLAQPICTEVAHATLRSILFTKHRPVHASLVAPPIQDRFAEQDFYKLATAYYEHACKDGDVERMSQLTRKIGSLFDMSGASMAAIALSLAVAVEALAQTGQLAGRFRATPEHLAVVESIKTTVLKLPELDDLTKQFGEANKLPDKRPLPERLDAVLSLLSAGGRTIDALRLLKDVGAVTGEEIKAWSDLRNPTAHGSWEPKDDRMQIHFDDLYKLLTLAYRLMFVHIGYDGKFEARNVKGWPVAEFKGKGVQEALGFQ